MIHRDIPGGTGLLDLRSGAFYELNVTGALLWTLLEMAPTVDELVEAIRENMPDSEKDVAGEVEAFVMALHSSGLIEIQSPGVGAQRPDARPAAEPPWSDR